MIKGQGIRPNDFSKNRGTPRKTYSHIMNRYEWKIARFSRGIFFQKPVSLMKEHEPFSNGTSYFHADKNSKLVH